MKVLVSKESSTSCRVGEEVKHQHLVSNKWIMRQTFTVTRYQALALCSNSY